MIHKIIITSLNVITLISFGVIGVNAYQLQANLIIKVGEAVIDDSFTPYFKSIHLYRSNGFSEARKFTLDPIQSEPIGITPAQLRIPAINGDASVEFAGETRQFVVDKKRYPYDTTALDDVFGPTSKQRLNLITCIGEFDQNAGTHSERLVVFTEQLN